MSLAVGSRLGAYEIIAPIGAGGMGEVYEARDTRLGRRVAIKVLSSHLAGDPVARERLRREAMAAAALDHPFICKVFELGESDRELFIVMEYVDGETMHNRLRGGPLPIAEVLRVAGEVAEAFEEAHSRCIVHRDLKPANVMLTGQGHVKVMDFGLAKHFNKEATGEFRASDAATLTQAGPALTRNGGMIGTPEYMSPEQIAGDDIDQRCDIFTFGILLCELLTGKHPFRRNSAAATQASILRDPPAIGGLGAPGLPPGVIILIRRLLAKPLAERYQSMAEAHADMARIYLIEPSADIETRAAASSRAHARLPLIGREPEHTELVRHVEEALVGRGSLVLIGGEPGIGKTHLVSEILGEAGKRGCVTLTGHCYETEGAPPYVPFIEMLEQSARMVPRATFRYALGDSAAEVAKLMPGLRHMFPDIPPPIELPFDQQRRYLFNSYHDYLERTCRVTPMVVVIEDLHWADEPTLFLLLHLAQIVTSVPLLILATYRDVELRVTRVFGRTLETLLRSRQATRIYLRRLLVSGVEAMLASMSGQQPPPWLAGTIFEKTEGNPFFVEEVFRHLAEAGELFEPDGAWRNGSQSQCPHVPESVRLVLGHRLERLGGEAHGVLTTAAILGRSFSLRLLEELEATRPDTALDSIEEAEKAQLVTAEPAGREPRYRFVHELVRQTLAEELSLPRRQRLHLRIADAIERVYVSALDTHVSALVYHLYQAGAAADPQRTIKYLLLATSHASAAAAHEEALAHLNNALSLVEEEHGIRLPDLHARRAGVLRSLARLSEAVAAYERAIDMFDTAGDVVKVAETSIPLAEICGWNADSQRLLAVTNRALQRLGGRHQSLRGRLLLLRALALMISGDIDSGLAALSEAKDIQEPAVSGDSYVYAHTEAHIRSQTMQFDLAEKACSQAFSATGDLWTQVEIEYIQVDMALCRGRLCEAESKLPGAAARAERIGHRNIIWGCKMLATALCIARGDLKAAQCAASESLAFGRSFQGAYMFQDEVSLGDVAYYQGRADEAIECFRRAAEMEPICHWTSLSGAALFLALARVGSPMSLNLLRERPPRLPVRGQGTSIGAWASLARVVEGLALLDRREEVAALEPNTEDLVATGVLCLYDINLFRTVAGIAAACTRNWTRAQEHHSTAVHQADTVPYRVAQPISRNWYAEMLLARGGEGDKARALVLLSETLSMYESLGMPGFAQRASERLASLS